MEKYSISHYYKSTETIVRQDYLIIDGAIITRLGLIRNIRLAEEQVVVRSKRVSISRTHSCVHQAVVIYSFLFDLPGMIPRSMDD